MITIQTHSINHYFNSFTDLLINYSPKLLSALLVLLVGLYAIRILNRLVRKIMHRRDVDRTLANFLGDIFLWTLRIVLIVTVISRLGIETSSFVAILGAAGLAIGLSLQGSLSNFAGGMLIILFKPFRVGDYIEAQHVSGTVQEIQIFVTKLLTANHQMVFIPNGLLSNGIIINYSMENIRRADLSFSISYETNIKTAKLIISEVLNNNPKILKNPIAEIEVKHISDSAIILAVRPWALTADYLQAVSTTLEEIKTAFDEKGIKFQPFVK